jgi:hypothetical protein
MRDTGDGKKLINRFDMSVMFDKVNTYHVAFGVAIIDSGKPG